MKNIFSGISLAFFVLSFFTVYSQKAPNQQGTSLKLLSGEYILNQNFKDFNNESFLRLSKCEGKSYGIIQFSTVPDKQLKAQLKDNYGINLLAYLPERCYFASFSS